MDEFTTVVITLITFLTSFTLSAAGILIFLIKTNALREKDLSNPAVICTSIHGAYNSLLIVLPVVTLFIGVAVEGNGGSGAWLAMLALLLIIALGIPSAGAGIPAGVLTMVLSVSCIRKPETKKKGIICTAVSALSFLISCGCMGIALWIILGLVFGWV